MKTAARFVVALFFALMLAAVFALASGAPTTPQVARVDVLVIEHAPAGPIERIGTLTAWQYTGTSMLLEYVPDGDAIYHNGFECSGAACLQ